VPLSCAPRRIDSSGVRVPFISQWRRCDSAAQGRRREAESEGSAEQGREPMNKNRMWGLQRRTSRPLTAKSISVKGAGGESCGRDLAAQTAGSSRGPWRLANRSAMNYALANTCLDLLGLLKLFAGA
jgi:hypothetical protein